MESCSIAFFVLEANPFRIRGETDQAGNMGLVKEEFNVLNAWREISMPFTVTMFSAKENEKVTNGHRSGLRGFLDFRRPSRWPSKAAGTAFIKEIFDPKIFTSYWLMECKIHNIATNCFKYLQSNMF